MKNRTMAINIGLCISSLFLAISSSSVLAAGGKGMTWAYRGDSIPGGNPKLVLVGCHGGPSRGGSCNAYQGETSCSVKRHILCVKESGNIKRPPYDVCPGGELYAGWSPAKIKLGPKKRGSDLQESCTPTPGQVA